MKEGDIVEIFTSPMKREHSERMATLVCLISKHEDSEYWLVRFPDGWTGPRLIKK